MVRAVAVAVLLVLASAGQAMAQAGACTPQTAPVGVVVGRSIMTFTSADHTAVDPAGALKIAEYFGEVRVKNDPAIVTTFTVPKASVTPATGSGLPANCYQTLLPAMGPGLLPSATYTLTLYARNPAGTLSPAPNPTADFFLSAASVPASPGNLRLVTP